MPITTVPPEAVYGGGGIGLSVFLAFVLRSLRGKVNKEMCDVLHGETSELKDRVIEDSRGLKDEMKEIKALLAGTREDIAYLKGQEDLVAFVKEMRKLKPAVFLQ